MCSDDRLALRKLIRKQLYITDYRDSVIISDFRNLVIEDVIDIKDTGYSLKKYVKSLWNIASLYMHSNTHNIFNLIRRRAIGLIEDPVLSDKLPSVGRRRVVGDLGLFHIYFHC